MSIRTVLLTGDSKPAADAVARQLGIDQVEAEVLPEGQARTNQGTDNWRPDRRDGRERDQ
jgi:cation transport ATPase